jgi:hypothetical protein
MLALKFRLNSDVCVARPPHAACGRVLRCAVPWLVLAALAATSTSTVAQSRKAHRSEFVGTWKTIKGQEGLHWSEPQTISIRQRGKSYEADGTPGFRAVGHTPVSHLVLTPKEGGRILEYVYYPGKFGIPRYYDLKLSADGALTTTHRSKFGLFGGAKYIRLSR